MTIVTFSCFIKNIVKILLKFAQGNNLTQVRFNTIIYLDKYEIATRALTFKDVAPA